MSAPVFRRTIHGDVGAGERLVVTAFDDGRVALTIDSPVGPQTRTVSAHFAARMSRLIGDAAKFSNPQYEKESSEKDDGPDAA